MIINSGEITNKKYSDATSFNLGTLLSPQVLFLIMLPVLAFLGAQLINYYNSDLALIVLILLIAIVPILALVFKLIPETLFPLALYCIGLALLWHFSLTTGWLLPELPSPSSIWMTSGRSSADRTFQGPIRSDPTGGRDTRLRWTT